MHPRTGYVAYRIRGRSILITMIVSGTLGAVVAGGLGVLMLPQHISATAPVQGVAASHDWLSLLWIGNAVILVAGYALFVYNARRQYPWKWLVLLFMVLGLLTIALISPANPAQLWRPMVVFVGLTWLVSGIATLCLFVRHTPPPSPGAE